MSCLPFHINLLGATLKVDVALSSIGVSTVFSVIQSVFTVANPVVAFRS